MTHYMIVSPEMSKVVPVLDDGTGPTEYFCCVCFEDAPNIHTALAQALRNEEMKPWVRQQRSDGKNPFSGLETELCECKHGKCWCPDCIRKFGECEICFEDLEKENTNDPNKNVQ